MKENFGQQINEILAHIESSIQKAQVMGGVDSELESLRNIKGKLVKGEITFEEALEMVREIEESRQIL